MTNLTIEILFWAILVSYLGLRFSKPGMASKNSISKEEK